MALTFFFAQFFGLMMLILGISLFVHRRMYASLLAHYRESRATIFAVSFTGLVVGMAAVLTHNVWSGGFLRVLVTIIGWLVFLKSTAFLILPSSLLESIYRPFGKQRAYGVVATVLIVVGLYLFLAGSGGR